MILSMKNPVWKGQPLNCMPRTPFIPPDGAKDEQGNPAIRYEKDDLVATLVTDTEGKAVVNNLPLGSYYLKENGGRRPFRIEPGTERIYPDRRG